MLHACRTAPYVLHLGTRPLSPVRAARDASRDQRRVCCRQLLTIPPPSGVPKGEASLDPILSELAMLSDIFFLVFLRIL